MLWSIREEHVLWSINVSAELEIVDLSNVALVEVFSQENLEQVLRWWNKSKLFQNSSELFSSDMATVCSIIILELRLNENSLVNDLSLDMSQ